MSPITESSRSDGWSRQVLNDVASFKHPRRTASGHKQTIFSILPHCLLPRVKLSLESHQIPAVRAVAPTPGKLDSVL